MNTPNTSKIPKLISFLLAAGLAGSTASAATWTGGGAGDSLITEANWNTAFTSTGNIGGVDYFGYNNHHAEVDGASTLTLGDGEWFRQDTSIAGYRFQMKNASSSLTIDAGARLSAGAGVLLSGGTIIQNGGLVEADSMSMSSSVATASSYTQNGGTLSISGGFIMQPTGTDSAVFTSSGGTASFGPESYLRARSDGDVSTFNVSGGDVTFGGNLYLGLNGWGAGQGDNTINLNSGTLRVNGSLLGDVAKADAHIVNFNGGTLATRPTAGDVTFGTAVQIWNVNSASTFELESGATSDVIIGPNLVLNAADLTFKNSDADNLLLMAGPAWTGTGGLVFEGANTDVARFQFQGGGNTFSGGATINSGYVRLQAGSTFGGGEVTAGGLGTGDVTFGNQGDSTLLLNYTTGDFHNAINVAAGSSTNTVLVLSRTANMTFMTGTAQIDGNLTIDNRDTELLVSSAVHTGSGELVLQDGIYQMQTTGNSVAGITVQNGAVLQHGVINGLTTDVAVTVESGGLWGIGGRSQQAGSIAGDGGEIVVQVNRGLSFGADNTDTEFAGVLSSTANAVAGSAYHNKLGTGTTTLSGNNTFEQYMSVGAGTLKLGSATALGAATKEFDGSDAWTLVQGTGSLDLNGLAIGDELIILRSTGGGNGGLTNSSATAASLTGTVDVNSTATASIDGTGTITLSTVNVASDSTLSILSDVILASGGTINAHFTVGASGSLTVPTTGNLKYIIDGGVAELIDNTAGGTVDITNLTLDVDETVAADGDYTILSGSYTGASFASVLDLPTDYTLVYNPTSIVLEAPVTATAFETWATGFSLSGGDELPGVDVENDGLTNLEEFVFGGNPTISEPGIEPAAVVSGTDLVFTFKRSDESEADGIVVIVQTNTDLTNALGWDDFATIGATDGTGYTVSENGSATDDITVTIPMGTDTEKFTRVQLQ